MTCKGHVCRAEYPGVRPWCPVCKKDMRKLSDEERLAHIKTHPAIEEPTVPDVKPSVIEPISTFPNDDAAIKHESSDQVSVGEPVGKPDGRPSGQQVLSVGDFERFSN